MAGLGGGSVGRRVCVLRVLHCRGEAKGGRLPTNLLPPRASSGSGSSKHIQGGWGVPDPPPLRLLEAPVRKIILQMHTPARSSQCWSLQTPHGLGVCIWMHLVNGTTRLWDSRPRSSQTGQVIRGLR